MADKKINPILEIKALANDMRRVLYMSKIIEVSAQGLSENAYCSQKIRKAISRLQNAMHLLTIEMKVEGSSESWQVIEEDYTSERIEDIGLLLDFISGVKNVAEVTNVLQEIFNEQLKAKQHAEA
jgi:hypothetical protein